MNYDSFADSLNLSPINSRVNSYIPGLGSKIDIDLVHDIYAINQSGNRINQYNNDVNGIPIPYLTKLNVRTSFALSGSRLLNINNSLNDSMLGSLEVDSKKLWSINLMKI